MEGAIIILSLLLAAAAFALYRLSQKGGDGGQQAAETRTRLEEKSKQLDDKTRQLEDQQQQQRQAEAEQAARAQQQQARLNELTGQAAAAAAELKSVQEAAQETARALAAAREDLRAKTAENAALQADSAALKTELDNEKNNAADKLKMLQDAKGDMEAQFKNLAQSILDEKTKKFSEDSRRQLTPLLDPLKQNIESFRGRLEALHTENTKERAELKNHIHQMHANASQISADAENLTRALTGSGKVQGDWGEQILLKLLENAGLKAGEHYQAQETHKSEEGRARRPDVIVYLPEGKHLVIDAKVSLSAYAEYTAAEDAEERAAAIKRHLASVSSHIKGLSETDYSGLASLNSPDFVMMFMPVEPAYMLALQEDNTLFSRAYDKNIILISPTTLMPVLRTVANIWRVEKQQQNARAIAEQGGALYDKFVGFQEDLEKVGEQLQRTQKTYEDAGKKLASGRGNLIAQAQKLRDMGVTSKKSLPQDLVTAALEGEARLVDNDS